MNKSLFYFLYFPLIISFGCKTTQNMVTKHFDEQAHRGGRGLMPENTIASQKNAIDFGCTLEMDLQMSKDKKIVVSHDGYFNSDFCLTPEGKTMTKEDGLSRLLFNMDYDSIAKYDVGLKRHPGFPRQKKIPASKPLLNVLIDSVEAYARQKNLMNHYNIEIKSNPALDGKTYSSLEEFVDLSMKIIMDKGIADRTMIQSFDARALQLVHKKFPGIKISFLVDARNMTTADGYIAELGFKRDVFSSNYFLVNEELVNAFHQQNTVIIPWTVNSLEEIQRLKSMGVDGVITDYPDLFSQLK